MIYGMLYIQAALFLATSCKSRKKESVRLKFKSSFRWQLTLICIPAWLQFQLRIAFLEPSEERCKVFQNATPTQLTLARGNVHDITPVTRGAQLHHLAKGRGKES